ncbi:Trehalose synthase [Porphyridium purpureum]|uniref:Trehalose synthase n=1 Tax=Porphyridium purpureum TaxID=35688 RepID=A0A5J4YWX1_PORPP|nr:Trehalose synthase [Porphyridium purpureum]|eukprot:POR3640..scf227_4
MKENMRKRSKCKQTQEILDDIAQYVRSRPHLHDVLPLEDLEMLQTVWNEVEDGVVSVADVLTFKRYAQLLNTEQYRHIVHALVSELRVALCERPPGLIARDQMLPDDWYTEPWYTVFVQYFGTSSELSSPASAMPQSEFVNRETPSASSRATFSELEGMLPYLSWLGYRNLLVLAHYESPMGDGGYDPSSYTPRADLGGDAGWNNFMSAANEQGFRIATDAIFNHVSIEHEWFQRACAGSDHYRGYFLERNDREKIDEINQDGDIICVYEYTNSGILERQICNFPEVDRTHGLWTVIKGETFQFYRSFYPFQVDLNLQSPEVLREVFAVIRRELNDGTLAKRLDAVPHWIKKIGYASDGLPETFALLEMIGLFMTRICPHAIVLPEVVRGMNLARAYAGNAAGSTDKEALTSKRLLFNFEMQAAIRYGCYFGTARSLVDCLRKATRDATTALPEGAYWVNLIDHHDEIFVGFFRPEDRMSAQRFLRSRNAVVCKNGLGAVQRIADSLNFISERIALGLFSMYVLPGVPMLYYGTELAVGEDPAHVKYMQTSRARIFERLGVTRLSAEMENSHTSAMLFSDPREKMRGPIPRKRFSDTLERATHGKDLLLLLLRRLNRLRDVHCAFKASARVCEVRANADCVLAVYREPSSDGESLLCVANFADSGVSTRLSGFPWVERGGHASLHNTVHFRDLLQYTMLRSQVRTTDGAHSEMLPDANVDGHIEYIWPDSPCTPASQLPSESYIELDLDAHAVHVLTRI